MSTKKTDKSKEKSPAIAIIGISGFLGSALLQALEKDPRYPRVIAIDRKLPSFTTKKAKIYRFDMAETLADSKIAEIFRKENVQQVVHTAFPTTPMHDEAEAHELQSVGTMYLLNASKAVGIKKLVVASTTDVYGAHATNPNYLSEKHPLRGGNKSRFIRDKIDAENQILKFDRRNPNTIVTILRPCTVLGPRTRTFKTTFLQRPAVFTVMGYDPLMQFVHEKDVLRALRKVIDEDHPGIFNIVGKGVLPLSQVLRLNGKIGIPVPSPLLYPIAQLLWYSDIFPAPASHLDFLKYLCVAEGTKAEKKMKFTPKFTSREALLSFIGSERLRKVHLLEDKI